MSPKSVVSPSQKGLNVTRKKKANVDIKQYIDLSASPSKQSARREQIRLKLDLNEKIRN